MEWVKKNPKQFGYNGIKGGMSGVAFVSGWVAAFAGGADKLEKGPYDAATKAAWDKALADLKEFNTNVVITPGNAGTLDMLNRGEIAMGPVWVDMFYTWMADGKLPPNMKLKLVAPGMPGQPMYYAVPAKANAKLAQEFVALATSPEVQAEGIVKRFNWYPGIDAKNLEGKLDQAAWKKLFADISPEDLQQGQAVPDRALLQRHPRSLRAQGRELTLPEHGPPHAEVRAKRASKHAHGRAPRRRAASFEAQPFGLRTSG